MLDSSLNPTSALRAARDGGRRVWKTASRGALMSGMILLSCWARADVYQEVNEKINASQWTAAQTLIDKQLQKQPADPQMRLMRSQMQAAQGQTALAMESLQVLTQEFPELPEPYNNLAVLLAQQQRFDEALTNLKLAIRARSDYSLALENLGDIYIALARQSYLQAQKQPQSPFTSARLENKIQLTAPLLQPVKP